MNKVMWKVSGLVFVTSSLVGLIGGLLAAPQSGARTRKKMNRAYEHIKDHVQHDVDDLKGAVASVAKQGKAYGENWLMRTGLSKWEQGFFSFPSIATAKITSWPSKEAH